ncbi:MAG: hypothetical protein KDD70_17965 [Bdellovibrionales bacterium]|nr:hypothetical protein [Bdellovibrionales bacterium]
MGLEEKDKRGTKASSEEGEASLRSASTSPILRELAIRELATNKPDSLGRKRYTEEENQLLREMVAAKEYQHEVPFKRMVPNWRKITEDFAEITGRSLKPDTLRAYFSGTVRTREEKVRSRRLRDLLQLRRGRSRVIVGKDLKAQAGALGAKAKGLTPFSREEDKLLILLAKTFLTETGRNKGLTDWDRVVDKMGMEFPKRSKSSYQQRLRKLQQRKQ